MIELNQLQPMIVPAEYQNQVGWDLPHMVLPNEEFILTWVNYDEAILYLDRTEFDKLEASVSNWQRKALDNVRQTEYFHRHHKGEEGKRPDWIAFLNDEDTVSSSKVLLQFELSRMFPHGYRIAIPDRACGIIVSNQCTGSNLVEVQQMIESMYATAATPMSPLLYASADFQIPTDWAIPFADDSTSAAILELFEGL